VALTAKTPAQSSCCHDNAEQTHHLATVASRCGVCVGVDVCACDIKPPPPLLLLRLLLLLLLQL